MIWGLYVANLQHISPANLIENLPYQPLFQQVPLEHPKPLPPKKNTLPLVMWITSLRVTCPSPTSKFEQTPPTRRWTHASPHNEQPSWAMAFFWGDLHRPPTMRHHLWGSKSRDQFEKNIEIPDHFQHMLTFQNRGFPVRFRVVFRWIPKKTSNICILHIAHFIMQRLEVSSLQYVSTASEWSFLSSNRWFPASSRLRRLAAVASWKRLQIGATLLKMGVVSSFCKYYSAYHLGINLCILDLFIMSNKKLSVWYTPSPSNWFNFSWNFDLTSFGAAKPTAPTLMTLWQGYSIYAQNWDNWDNSPGAERHTPARWAVDVPGASRLNQSLDVMGLKIQ